RHWPLTARSPAISTFSPINNLLTEQLAPFLYNLLFGTTAEIRNALMDMAETIDVKTEIPNDQALVNGVVDKDRNNAPKVVTRGLNLFYGPKQALKDITLTIQERRVTAFIGPSGCGKSTYLRTLNRMNDLIPNVKITGQVLVDNID